MKLCGSCEETFETPEWTCPRCGRQPPVEDGIPLLAPALTHGDGTDGVYHLAEIFRAEPEHFWFEGRRRAILWAMRTYFPAARTFFELGCGTGFVLAGLKSAYPSLQLCGSELLVPALAYARRRVPDVPLLQMDARRIPFREEFDVIGAFDVLEHVTEDEAVLCEIWQALRPSGGVVLTVPQHQFLWSSVDAHSGHRRRYSRSDLVAKLQRQGFRILRAASLFSMLAPLLMASRLRRLGSGDPELADELKIGAVANRALSAIVSLERALMHTGVSLPVGGSLLVVAQRIETVAL